MSKETTTKEKWWPGPRLTKQHHKDLAEIAEPVNVIEFINADHQRKEGLHPKVIERHDRRDALELVTLAYYGTTYPLQHRSMDEWIDTFAQLGVKAGKPNPKRKMLLFRGAHRDHPHGLSWTPFCEIAYSHADRVGDEAAVFWMVATAPEFLRVRTFPSNRLEPHEVIVDSRPHNVRQLFDLNSIKNKH